MKIEEIKPNIRQFMFRQERGDPGFGSCLWASFIIDCEQYILYISSDCGDYVYGWTPTPKTEPFTKLLSRINGDYLLSKIAVENVFDFEESLNQIIEWLKDDNASHGEIDKFRTDMKWEAQIGMAGCADDAFKDVCTEILIDIGHEGLCDYDENSGCVYDYPSAAKMIVHIFTEYLQPILRKDNDNGEN